ncbi:MAG: hypothetical protein WDZ42_02560 [Candidatus Saccharimonadales bacterium]
MKPEEINQRLTRIHEGNRAREARRQARANIPRGISDPIMEERRRRIEEMRDARRFTLQLAGLSSERLQEGNVRQRITISVFRGGIFRDKREDIASGWNLTPRGTVNPINSRGYGGDRGNLVLTPDGRIFKYWGDPTNVSRFVELEPEPTSLELDTQRKDLDRDNFFDSQEEDATQLLLTGVLADTGVTNIDL